MTDIIDEIIEDFNMRHGIRPPRARVLEFPFFFAPPTTDPAQYGQGRETPPMSDERRKKAQRMNDELLEYLRFRNGDNDNQR